jgi:putative NADPH-quinone reductase
MNTRRILIVQGHPDPAGGRFGHALAAAYADAAVAAGHEVRRVDVAALDFPVLRSQADWQHGPMPPALHAARDDLLWAQHLLLLFPLWMGDMPALLKAFLEQLLRPGFAIEPGQEGPLGRKKLSGRSARIVATMGMPAAVYRWFYRAHSLKSLERNILGMVGIGPIEETLIGMVDSPDAAGREKALAKLAALGRAGA